MSSGKARSPILLILGIILLLLLLAVAAALIWRSRQIGLPASEGMPTAVPAPAQAVPTQPPLVPTAAPPLVPTVAPPQPTVVPPVPTSVQPSNAVIIPNVAPVPQGGAVSGDSSAVTGSQTDQGISSVEPYPVMPGSSGAGSGSSSSASSRGSSGVRCGVRVRHVVRPGENLFRIALRYNTTTRVIARLNNIPDVRQIRSGQRLTIITCRQGGNYPSRTSYVVRPGDNLFRIALRYGTTIESLRAANGLWSNLIYPGQVLRIA